MDIYHEFSGKTSGIDTPLYDCDASIHLATIVYKSFKD